MEIKKGDHIVVSGVPGAPGEHPGTVISAANYGTADQPNWYIEFRCDYCAGSHYWKQGLDGGQVRKG